MVSITHHNKNISWKLILWLWRQHKLIEEHVNLSDINYLKNIFISINKIIYKCSPLIKIIFEQVMGNGICHHFVSVVCRKHSHLNLVLCNNWTYIKPHFTEMVPFQIDSQDLRSRWPLLLKIVFFIVTILNGGEAVAHKYEQSSRMNRPRQGWLPMNSNEKIKIFLIKKTAHFT
jgi:hypothetical protein